MRQLAQKGITAILGSRDEEQGRAAAEGFPDNVLVRQLDVADEKSVDRLAISTEEEFGRLDILVNNAGIANDRGQSGVDADHDRVREALEANLFGAWRMCEAFIPLMQRHHYGRIVNISSGMGALNDMGGGSPGYRLSKAGLNVLTRILASELRGSGILVNSVCPGWVRTDMGGSGATRSVEEGADTPVCGYPSGQWPHRRLLPRPAADILVTDNVRPSRRTRPSRLPPQWALTRGAQRGSG